jgi:hypothetical protein
VARLERGQRCRCASGVVTVVAVLLRYPGEPEPEVPDDLPPGCPVCGGGTAVLVEEIVVVGPDGCPLPPPSESPAWPPR